MCMHEIGKSLTVSEIVELSQLVAKAVRLVNAIGTWNYEQLAATSTKRQSATVSIDTRCCRLDARAVQSICDDVNSAHIEAVVQ